MEGGRDGFCLDLQIKSFLSTPKVVGEVLSGKTFKQRPEDCEVQAGRCVKSVVGKGNSRCKGPKTKKILGMFEEQQGEKRS